MQIETKYSFGQEVYVVFKELQTVKVYKDVVTEISFSEKYGLRYYVKTSCEDFVEKDLIGVNDITGLVNRINELLGGQNEENE